MIFFVAIIPYYTAWGNFLVHIYENAAIYNRALALRASFYCG
jgi:hypothetical protein